MKRILTISEGYENALLQANAEIPQRPANVVTGNKSILKQVIPRIPRPPLMPVAILADPVIRFNRITRRRHVDLAALLTNYVTNQKS